MQGLSVWLWNSKSAKLSLKPVQLRRSQLQREWIVHHAPRVHIGDYEWDALPRLPDRYVTIESIWEFSTTVDSTRLTLIFLNLCHFFFSNKHFIGNISGLTGVCALVHIRAKNESNENVKISSLLTYLCLFPSLQHFVCRHCGVH